jgi:hypothetical protein
LRGLTRPHRRIDGHVLAHDRPRAPAGRLR